MLLLHHLYACMYIFCRFSSLSLLLLAAWGTRGHQLTAHSYAVSWIRDIKTSFKERIPQTVTGKTRGHGQYKIIKSRKGTRHYLPKSVDTLLLMSTLLCL